MCGEIEVGVNASGRVLRRSGHADAWRLGVDGLPTDLSVERGDAVAVGKVHDRIAFVWRFSEDLDRDMAVAGHCECALLDAARNFLERSGAADGGKIFVEELVCRGQSGFFLAGL